MLEQREQGLFSLSELNHLRIEAMHLFEQCLTEEDETPLVQFVEKQLAHTPPRLQLLQDLADDLQQRLLSLREYHFDVRERVVRTIWNSYRVDITPIAPPADLNQYHTLSPTNIIAFVQKNTDHLSDEDSALLQKMVEASLKTAAQLHQDIQLTNHLHQLVLDWVEGMQATIARQYWNDIANNPHHDIQH
jgi:uncharacterized protein YeaO (DUF488 family)